jgi:hypothetical protein
VGDISPVLSSIGVHCLIDQGCEIVANRLIELRLSIKAGDLLAG